MVNFWCWATDAETDGDVAVVREVPEAIGRAAAPGVEVPRTTTQWYTFNGFTRCSTHYTETEGVVAAVRVIPEAEGRAAVPGDAVPRATAQGYTFNRFLVCSTHYTETEGVAAVVRVVPAAVGRAAAPGVDDPRATAHQYTFGHFTPPDFVAGQQTRKPMGRTQRSGRPPMRTAERQFLG